MILLLLRQLTELTKKELHEKNKHIGSMFDSYLKRKGILEHTEAVAIKRLFMAKNILKIYRKPVFEVPAQEVWLFAPENKKILKQVIEGVEQKKKGRLIDRGSFAKYAKGK